MRRAPAVEVGTVPAQRTGSAPDPRVVAAARVLAGERAEDVAAGMGVDASQVRRWAHGLSTGGAAAVAGVGLARPGAEASLRVPVEDYLGVLAHELRTPLGAAVVGLSLLGRPDLAPEHRERISASVVPRLEQLQQLAEDLVVAVGVTTGTTALRREDVAVAPALVRACADAGLPVPTGAVGTLEARVHADPARLAQLLRVLCTHARRYRETGSTARLQVAGDAVLVTVRVPDVDLGAEKAGGFEPFGAAATGDGNGLALYVLRALAVAHGGQVGMAGQSGEHAASVLWVSLPLAADGGGPP